MSMPTPSRQCDTGRRPMAPDLLRVGDNEMAVSRREFLIKGATTVAVGLAVPPWLAKMVWADTNATFGAAGGGNRILVVIQLTGGNDGLNTFIPYSAPEYALNRPTLA